MNENQLKFLYDNYGKSQGFADYNEFKSLMENDANRKLFFDASNKDLGFTDYNEFESLLGVKKKGVTTPDSSQPAKPSAPSFGQKVVGEAITQEVQIPLRGQQKAPVQKKPYQDITYKREQLPSETTQMPETPVVKAAKKDFKESQIKPQVQLKSTPEELEAIEKKTEKVDKNGLILNEYQSTGEIFTDLENINEGEDVNAVFSRIQRRPDLYAKYSGRTPEEVANLQGYETRELYEADRDLVYKNYLADLQSQRINHEKSLAKANVVIRDILNEKVTPETYGKYTKDKTETTMLGEIVAGPVVDMDKVDEEASAIAEKYNIPPNGAAWRLIKNNLKSDVDTEIDRPQAEVNFKTDFAELNTKRQELFDAGFQADEAIYANAEAKLKSLEAQYQQEAKNEFDAIDFEYKTKADQLNKEYAQYTDGIKKQQESLTALYQSGQIDQLAYESAWSKLAEDEKAFYENYKKEFPDNAAYVVKSNEINSRYNRKYELQKQAIASRAEAEMQEAYKKYALEYKEDPELLKKMNDAYRASFEKATQQRAAKMGRAAQLSANPISTFYQSTASALGGVFKGWGGSMNSKTLEVLGESMEQSFMMPKARTKEFSDWIDPQNVVLLSGQLAGSMLPSMTASAAVAIGTQGAGLPVAAQLIAGGLAGWASETVDIVGRSYLDRFEGTGGNVAEANLAAERSLQSQYDIMFSYSLDALPFVGKALKFIPTIAGRVATGVGAELLTEMVQEYPQNIADENIQAGREPWANLNEVLKDTKRMKETLISIGPVAILGGAGQLGTKSKKSELRDAYIAMQQKSSLNNALPDQKRQYIQNMVFNKNAKFAKGVIGTLFASGKIDEKTSTEMLVEIDRAEKIKQAGKSAGLSGSKLNIYGFYSARAEEAERNAAKFGQDPILSESYKQMAKQYRDAGLDFMKGGKPDLLSVTYADGSQALMVPEDANALFSDANALSLLSKKAVSISAYKEGGQGVKIIDELKGRAETYAKKNRYTEASKMASPLQSLRENIQQRTEQLDIEQAELTEAQRQEEIKRIEQEEIAAFEAKEKELEQQKRDQRDLEIEQIQQQREALGVNEVDAFFSDMKPLVGTTVERMEQGKPAPKSAVKVASEYLYAKYKELTAMKSDPNRMMTIAQIESIQAQIEQDLETLEGNPPSQKTETNDQENIQGVPGEVGEAKKPVTTEPIEVPSAETPEAGGVLQAPEEEVTPTTEAAPEVKAEEKPTAPATEETKPTKPTRKERLAGLFEEEEKPAEKPTKEEKAEPQKVRDRIEYVANKFRNKIRSQIGNARGTLSRNEVNIFEKEIRSLEQKAIQQGTFSYDEKRGNANYEKVDGNEQKVNTYEADGYKIEYESTPKSSFVDITTPSGERIRLIDPKYRNQANQEVIFYPAPQAETIAEPMEETKPASPQEQPTRKGKIASLFEEEETTQAGKESSDEAFVDEKIEQVKENGKPLSEFKEGDRVIWASDRDPRFKQYVEGVVVKENGEYGIKRSSQNPLSKKYPVAIFNGSTLVIPKPEGDPIYTGPENLVKEQRTKTAEVKTKAPQPAKKALDKKGIPSKFTKDNIDELVGATVVVIPGDGPMKVLEVRGPFDPYEGYATFNTKKGLTEEYVLIGEDDGSTSVFINDKGQLESSIEESVFTSDPNAKFILKEATEGTPLSITKFKKGDIVKYVEDGQQYEVLSVDPKALSSIKNIQTGEVIKVAYPADFLPSSREEVVTEKAETTPAEAVVEAPAEETPIRENEAVNQLITKKNRYNKIPKSRKAIGANLPNQIKQEAETLGFTVVNVKGGNISVVSKENGKVVARRDVDRKFNKERNDKLKEAKSMAQDSLLGLRASILLYFMQGGKVMTSQSELAGKSEIAAAKKAGFISDTGRSVDMIALEDLPELGGIISDEQDAINEILDVLASYENKAQMEDDLIEMRDKLNSDMDEAAKYEYESQMRAAIRNDELQGLDEDQLNEYYESLIEDEKVKAIEDYEKFYQEIEREQREQGGQGRPGAYPSEGTAQEVEEPKAAYEESGVKDFYSSVPGLKNIGTLQQYTEYLNSIFPNSKVKEILYRGYRSQGDKGKYFTPNKDYTRTFGSLRKAVVVNAKNLLDLRDYDIEMDEGLIKNTGRQVEIENLWVEKDVDIVDLIEKADAVVGIDSGMDEVAYYVKNETFELGTKEDLDAFEKFVKTPKTKITDGPNEGLTRTDTAAGPFVSESGNIPYSERGGVRGETVRAGGVGNTVKAVWNKYKQIKFNGSTKVKDADDVAHIMRKLEDKSVEHAFAVHVDKDGNSHIQFLGMGGPTSTIVDPRLILAGVKKFKSAKVYLVHNHPSGSLVASRPDIELTNRVDAFLSPLGIELEHVIMDTYKKEYVHLYPDDLSLVKKRDISKETIADYNKALKAEMMDEQKILSEPVKSIRNSMDVSEFLMQLRFTALPKHGMLLLNNKNEIIGNYIFKKGFDYKEAVSFVADSAIGTGAIFYSNQDQFESGVKPMIRSLEAADVKVLDYVIMNSESEGVRGYYQSYADENKLRETQTEYGTNSIPNELMEPTSRTNAEIQGLMEDAADAVEAAIDFGTEAQKAVNDIVGSQDWYIELSPKIKQRFNEILQDEFGATPKVQTKAKTPVTEPASKTSTNIQNIVDNYYKLREGSKDEKRAAKAAINEILDADPKLKYIYNNISNINKELQAAGLITDKTDGCP